MSEPLFPLTAAVIEAALVEKNKRIAYLEENLAEWIKEAEQRGNDMALLNRTILMQQQRLAEATFLIERIGTVSVGNGDVIRAAQNWLKPLG